MYKKYRYGQENQDKQRETTYIQEKLPESNETFKA